jgi:SHS2 domain-containing protein
MAQMNGGCSFEHFEHEADMGIRGCGPDASDAFAQAALAMTAIISDPDGVEAKWPVSIHCEAPDLEILLVDWLNALIYEMATRRMLFSRFDVRIENLALQATAWGETLDVQRHQPAVEVKGASYTELAVRQSSDGRWIAQCVVDV